MSNEPIRVLLVDDDPDFCQGLARWLGRRGYQVDTAAHGGEALRCLARARPYHVALIDFALEPGPNGVEVMRRIKLHDPEIVAIIFTGFGLERDAGLEALREGAYRYLPKSAHREEIAMLIQSAVDYRAIRSQLARTTAEKETLKALYEARQRKLTELAALNEIGRAIAAAVRLDDLPRLIYEQTSRVIDTTNFLVALCDWHAHQLDFVLRYEHGELITPHRHNADLGLIGHLVRQRSPLLLRGVAENRAFRHEHGIELIGEEAHSWLGVPILSGAQVLGAIVVQDYTREGAYSDDQRELLQIIANYAAVAIENARLFEQADQARRTVEGTARQLTMLHRITTYLQDPRIAAHLDLTLNLILTGVTAEYGLRFDRAAILLLDKTRNALTGHMGIGHLDEAAARQTWGRLVAERATLDRYVGDLLEGRFERTPLDRLIRQLVVPLETDRLVRRALRHQHAMHVTAPPTETSLTQVFDPDAFVVAPLVSGGEPIGLIVADNRFSRDVVTRENLELLDIFANEAAIAIENAHLNQETQRRMLELDRVGEAARVVTMSLELREVLQQIVTLASEVAHSDHTSVVLVQGGELIDSVEDFGARFPEIPPLHQRARPEGQTRQVARTGEPVAFDHVEADDPTHNPYLREVGIRSYAGLPLKVKDELVGVLFVHSFELSAFQELTELLTIFAYQAAIAIANARLFQGVQERARTRDALLQVEQQITSAIPDRPRAVLEAITWGACEVTGADCAAIYPYVVKRRAYDTENVAAHGLLQPEHFHPSDQVPEYDVAAGIIGDSQGRRIVADVEREAPELRSQSHFIRREQIRAFVGVRLDAAEEPVGVLFVNWRQPHAPAQDELDLIKILANYAAIAIQNARLYERTSERLQRRVEELERLHQINQQISATLQPGRVFELILAAALELTEGQRGELWLMDGASGALTLEIAYGEHLGQPGPARLQVGQGVVGKAVRERQLYLVPDVRRGYWARVYPQDRSRGRSVMAVPLLLNGEVLGAIAVASTEPDAFDRDAQQLLKRLAAQVVIAIQNATQYQAVARQRSHLEALHSATKAIASTLNLDQILAQLVEQVRHLVGTDTCSIALLDEETGDLIFEAISGPSADVVRGMRLERGQGIAGWVAETGQPAIVPDTREDTRFFPGVDQRTGAESRSILCVPMAFQGRVIGVIEVVNPPTTTSPQEQIETLDALAGLAAIALQNAHLYQEATERQVESQALQEVSISQAQDRQALLEVVMREALRLTNTDSGSILLWDSERGTFTQTLTTTGPDGSLQAYPSTVRQQGGIAHAIVTQQRPIVIADTWRDQRVNPTLIERGRRALIGVPLVSGSGPIGVLYVSTNAPRRFPPRTVTLLTALAGQATVAIEYSRQYEELKKAQQRLAARTAVAWMGMVGSTWSHAVTGRAATIAENVTLAQEWLRQGRPPAASEVLDRIEHEARAIRETLLTEKLSSEERAESVAVNALLRERLPTLVQARPDVRVRWQLDLDDGATVRGTRRWLIAALDVVVQNALEAMAGTEAKILTITTRQVEDQVEIQVHDTGKGIPAEVAEQLFHKPIHKGKGERGSGMGLLLASTILQEHGGDIRLAQRDAPGTTMALYLPLEDGRETG